MFQLDGLSFYSFRTTINRAAFSPLGKLSIFIPEPQSGTVDQIEFKRAYGFLFSCHIGFGLIVSKQLSVANILGFGRLGMFAAHFSGQCQNLLKNSVRVVHLFLYLVELVGCDIHSSVTI